MDKLPYFLLRLMVGTSLLGHGLVRLPKLDAFSHWMLNSFEKAVLPRVFILPFSYALPIAEFVIGCLLLLGFLTRIATVSGCLVMCMLIFGSCMIENWEFIPSQLLHAVILVVLLQFASSNKFSVDQYFLKK